MYPNKQKLQNFNNLKLLISFDYLTAPQKFHFSKNSKIVSINQKSFERSIKT